MKYVQHVRGNWVARMTVPAELRAIIGKRELYEDLGGDKKESERRALALINRFHLTIEDAREKLASSRPTLSFVAKDHFAYELVADDAMRAHPDMRTTDAMKHRAYSRNAYAPRLRMLVAGNVELDEAEALIGYAADRLAEKGLAPDTDRADLLKALAEVQLEVLRVSEERDNGRVSIAPPTSPLLTVPEATQVQPVNRSSETGATLTEVLTAFHRERNARGSSLSAGTMDEHESAVRMFNEFLGKEARVSAIVKKDVIGYKNALLDTPTRYVQRFPGYTLPQAIRANKKRSEPYETLSAQTINVKWLSHLSSILRWAVANGYIDINPAEGVKVDLGNAAHREATRVHFEKPDLEKIFGHTMFDDPAVYETRQWALLIALYTGARSSSEIARLKVSDLTEEQGVSVFHFSGASKNQHSKRMVPVHQDLIALGIQEYVQHLRARGQDMLFPDWQPGDKVNRWFLRSYLPELGITDKRKVMHSFRHTLKTQLTRSGCSMEISNLITGHKDQSVAAVYVHDAPLIRMRDALNLVNFGIEIGGILRN